MEGGYREKLESQLLESLGTQLSNAARQIPAVLANVETLQYGLRWKIG